jgi:lysophospholipase L1-like esterase
MKLRIFMACMLAICLLCLSFSVSPSSIYALEEGAGSAMDIVQLYNVEETIDDGNGGELLSRVPGAVRSHLNSLAQSMALCGTGVELRFNMVSDSVKITLQGDNPISFASAVEIYFGSFNFTDVYGPIYIGDSQTVDIVINRPDNMMQMKQIAQRDSLPYDPELVRVILPYATQVRLVDIQGDISAPRADQSPSLKYLAYGTSITQGAFALSAAGTYAARTAHRIGADLINLGFAGSAFLEPEMADYIAERDDWDIATLELGANLLTTVSVEEFERRVDYFVSRIAEANQDKWIFCIDLFTLTANINGVEKSDDFRRVVREKVESLNLPRLVHIDGRDLLSANGLLSDKVHPSPFGMEEISVRLAGIISQYTGIPMDQAIVEGESGTLVGSAALYPDGIASNGTGVSSFQFKGDAVVYQNVPKANKLSLVYAQLYDAHMNLYVNNELVTGIDFPPTGYFFGIYDVKTIDVNIPEGAEIKFQVDRDDGTMGASIDYIIFGNEVEIPEGLSLEAEFSLNAQDIMVSGMDAVLDVAVRQEELKWFDITLEYDDTMFELMDVALSNEFGTAGENVYFDVEIVGGRIHAIGALLGSESRSGDTSLIELTLRPFNADGISKVLLQEGSQVSNKDNDLFTLLYTLEKGVAIANPDVAGNDGQVRINDLTRTAELFMKESGQDGYDAKCDFNKDGIIDIVDHNGLPDD